MSYNGGPNPIPMDERAPMPDDEKPPETGRAEPEAEDSDEQSREPLVAQVEEYREKLERAENNWKLAEAALENAKKRAKQERRDLTESANADLVKSLLPILDDMERAFDSLDAGDARPDWVEGLDLVYRNLLSTLEGQGLSVIPSVGEPFDPTMHDAVMQMEGEAGVVVGELQKGYRFGDRLLRPAKVQVGAGDPKDA